MTPSIGQTVVLYLRYSIVVEGSVYEWSEDEIVLKAGENYLVIYNPSEDMIMCKLVGAPSNGSAIRKPDIRRGVWDFPETSNVGVLAAEESNQSGLEGLDVGVVSDYDTTEPEDPNANHIGYDREEIDDEITETIAMPSANDLRIKKLATLRSMMQQAEQAIVANKLKSHEPATKEAPVQYANQLSILSKSQ
jgi:hypothetical protein